jgi:hypothetical protein
MDSSKVFKMAFASVYPHYIAKATKKGRTQEEVDTIICWLTGFNTTELKHHLESGSDLKTFYNSASINPLAYKITGMICGYRVEEISDPLMQKIRYLDKLIDELAKGKALDKILRS